jgi:hypothetical protein
LLDYSSNKMKKKIRISKKLLYIFLKRWPVCTSKNQWKKLIFSSNLFKNEDFFKISKTNDSLNYFKKNLQNNTFRKHFSMLQKVQKKTFFCDVTKVENFDKKCLTLSKKNKKSPFKQIRFGRSKSPEKGLRRGLWLSLINFNFN